MTDLQRLGPYTVTGVLGEGSMGVVYKGFDPLIERPVAIKTIRRSLLTDSANGASAVARFKIEAQAAGRLNHPGIVSVYQFGEDQDYAYIAMEYVEGHTLREYLSRGVRFGEQDVLSIMVQLLDALEFAHGRGVLHRDIKPANLIVARSGKLKIADFGIARIDSANVTRVNTVIGSPGYMSPEQYSGGEIDRRVDVFSSGVLLYQLMTGRLPFTGTDDAVMYKIVYEDPLPPSKQDGCDHWAHFDPLIVRALAKAPADRFQSARQFRDALLALAGAPVNELLSEETIEASVAEAGLKRRMAMAEAAARSGSRPVTPSNTIAVRSLETGHAMSLPRTSPSTTTIDEKTLSTVERELAHYVGPVAKVLVRRAARDCLDVDTLRTTVARHIPTEAEQTKFLGVKAASKTQGTLFAQRTQLVENISQEPLSTALVERTAELLNRRIGPIAKILVKRAAADAGSAQQFRARLLDSVAGDTDRAWLSEELSRVR